MDRPEVCRLFAQQLGVAATSQLGVSRATLRRARANGVVDIVLPGVVRSTSQRWTFEAQAMAVQLLLGDFGCISGPTAGRLLGLRNMPSRRIWALTAKRLQGALPSWVDIASSSWFDPAADVILVGGCFRVLRPVRVLLRLAEMFTDHRFERAAEDAWHLGLVSPDQAADFLERWRRSGRGGIARFERWLEKTATRTRPIQSEFELDVLEAIRNAGLPEPQCQHPIVLLNGETIHLDIAWPALQLAVEPGHSWWHGGDLKMRADQARDRACKEVGWEVVRYDEAARADLPGVGRELASIYSRRASMFHEP
jgi:hypothetical protein